MTNFNNFALNWGLVWSGVICLALLVLGCKLFDWIAPKELKDGSAPVKARIAISLLVIYAASFLFIGYRSAPRKPKETQRLSAEGKLKVPEYKSRDVMKSGDQLQESGQDSLDKFRKRLLKSKSGSTK